MDLAIVDHLVHHVCHTMIGSEFVDDGPEGRPVVAEAAQVFGCEGFRQQVTDLGDVVLLRIVGHSIPPTVAFL
jgi:hypothetical protein